MKNPPEICAKCSARTIATGPINAGLEDIKVHTYKDPSATFFQGEKHAKLVAAICLTCGYVELYVDDLTRLARPPA